MPGVATTGGRPYTIVGDLNEQGTLQWAPGCVGADADPVAATFAQVYHGALSYVLWNDQFYQDPAVAGWSDNSCSASWGHSKGLVAWNEAGTGLVLPVTTPSWPAAGNVQFPRQKDGNTLGCVTDTNVKVSQHFFALKLTKADPSRSSPFCRPPAS